MTEGRRGETGGLLFRLQPHQWFSRKNAHRCRHTDNKQCCWRTCNETQTQEQAPGRAETAQWQLQTNNISSSQTLMHAACSEMCAVMHARTCCTWTGYLHMWMYSRTYMLSNTNTDPCFDRLHYLTFISWRLRSTLTWNQLSTLTFNCINYREFVFTWFYCATWFHGVTVSTLDSESSNPSSNLSGT